VVAAEQSSNNDKGDVENAFQVLAELKKQQREAPFFGPENFVWRHVLHMRPSTGCRGSFAQAVAAGPKRNLGPLSGLVLYDRNLKAPQMDAPVQYTVLAEIPATNPADGAPHSTKKFGLHQPRPSLDPPSSVTGSSTAATTPRPLA
jgi:hypothetical protein